MGRRILLIGLDGADWKIISPLVDEGKMPNLEKLINNGVIGNIASIEPMFSPILWTSIATGNLPDKHRILSFVEFDSKSGNIRPVSSNSRCCKAIWNILSERGLKCGVVNWIATYPAEKMNNGFIISDEFCFSGRKSHDDSIYPAELKEELVELIVYPSEITLQQLLPFIQKIWDVDIKNDKNLHTLIKLLAQCATVHNITTYVMSNKEWDFLCTYYPTIDRFSHAFMKYHLPQSEDIFHKDSIHYRYVIEGCYRFHDMMLGRLIEIAGEETTIIIVSDHGFYHGNLKSFQINNNKPHAYHRKYGIFIICGEGIKKDTRIYGASILDVVPTILAILKLPVPKDMDGNVLRQIFEDENFSYEFIDTYEDKISIRDSENTIHVSKLPKDLETLGYIDISETEIDFFKKIEVDKIINLSIVYTYKNRPEMAIKELEKLPPKYKDEISSKHLRVINLIKLAKYNEAEEILREIVKKQKDDIQTNYLMGQLYYYQGKNANALEYLHKAEAYEQNNPYLYCQIGQVYLKLGKWKEAQKAFLKALEIDDENAYAYDGLGITYQKAGNYEKAVEAHMKSVALLHYQPLAHCHLGIALLNIGRIHWAIQAFKIATEQAPDNPMFKRLLAEIISKIHDKK